MIDSVPAFGACKRIASTLTLAALAATLAGCGSGSGGGSGGSAPNFGVFQPDRHGNTPATATRLYPDNGWFEGAINSPNDRDWFKHEWVVGSVYVLQFFGFETQSPDINTGIGSQTGVSLLATIIFGDGSTQWQSSVGNAEGTLYDIDPAPTETEDGEFVFGDSRIIWVGPSINNPGSTSGTIYIKLEHDFFNGVGNYRLNLASSNLGFAITPNATAVLGINRRNWRFAQAFNDNGELLVNQYVQGAINAGSISLDPGQFSAGIGATSDLVFLIDPQDFTFEDTPEAAAVHLHLFNPDIYLPRGDGTSGAPHPRFAELSLARSKSSRETLDGRDIREAILPGTEESDEPLRIPMQVDAQIVHQDDTVRIDATVSLDLAAGGKVRQSGDAEVLRRITGFQWYADVHYTDNIELDSRETAVSGFNGDIYSMFEGTLFAAPENLLTRDEREAAEDWLQTRRMELDADLERNGMERVAKIRQEYADGFPLLYDASFNRFGLYDKWYDPGERPINPNPGFNPDDPFSSFGTRFPNPPVQPFAQRLPDFPCAMPLLGPFVLTTVPDEFVGLRIDIHRGGPGQSGPVAIPLGTVPEPDNPPGLISFLNQIVSQDCTYGDGTRPVPGLFGDQYSFEYEDRTLVRQLSQAEVRQLRNLYYYQGGFHILVKDQKLPGSPAIARAEATIGIQAFPNDPPPLQTRSDGMVVDNHGTVRFATTYAGGSVTVIANGEILGDLTLPVDGEAPECGDDPPGSVVSARLLPDEYYYRAYADDGTEWDGIFTIDGMGSCNTILLAPN